MKIGIPKEIKEQEYRISATPALVKELSKRGHQVFIEKNGANSIGFFNKDYEKAGATILDSAEEIFFKSDLIVKVKEPMPEECEMLKENQILFTYLHLASSKKLTDLLINSGSSCIAYETIKDKNGKLPLLMPMSQIAGRLSIQAGVFCLEKTHGGKGVLLSGVPGTEKGKVIILGGGVVGINAAIIALGFGADVIIFDNNIDKLCEIENIFGSKIKTIFSNNESIEKHLKEADICVGSVLVPGASAPKLVTKEMVALMEEGSVLVDVAIDQGGCFETSKATTHSNPTYLVDGKIHYCVTNMPGCVAKTSTIALTNSSFPYVLKLADSGIDALKKDLLFSEGLNIFKGKITHKEVANSLNLEYKEAFN